MYVKVPEVKRCCCCFPLRYGIVIFGFLNVLFAMLAVAYLVVSTELKRSSTSSASMEAVTETVLYSILGMGVILNIILLVGGCQKDISMLRLYNYYAVLTTLAAAVPLIILLARRQYVDVCFGLVAVATQMYVCVLVRSEVVKLETRLLNPREASHDVEIATPDTDTLL